MSKKCVDLLLKHIPLECGDLLAGVRVVSIDGVEEWFDFPRYRVVAFHMNGKIMFLEVLDPNLNIISIATMDILSDQWKRWT